MWAAGSTGPARLVEAQKISDAVDAKFGFRQNIKKQVWAATTATLRNRLRHISGGTPTTQFKLLGLDYDVSAPDPPFLHSPLKTITHSTVV